MTRFNHWRPDPARGNAFLVGTLHADGRFEYKSVVEGEPTSRECRCGGRFVAFREGLCPFNLCRKCSKVRR